MKITKHGTLPEKRLWRGVCSKCDSEAEAFESELTNIKHDWRGEKFSWEQCPVCKAGGHRADGYNAMLFHPVKEKEQTFPPRH